MEKFSSDMKFCDLTPNSLLRNKLSTKFSKMNKICYRCISIRKFDGFGPACHGHIYFHTVGTICQNSFVSMKSQRLHQIQAGGRLTLLYKPHRDFPTLTSNSSQQPFHENTQQPMYWKKGMWIVERHLEKRLNGITFPSQTTICHDWSYNGREID